jgi:hypothetical protein
VTSPSATLCPLSISERERIPVTIPNVSMFPEIVKARAVSVDNKMFFLYVDFL